MMEMFPVTLGILLAVAAIGSCQVMGTPGTEPWSMIVMPACQMKGVDVTTVMGTASQCLAQLSGPNPLGICQKKKERDACLKPYYDEIKKCFDKAEDVEQAFEAQKGAVEFYCKDNGKQLLEMTPADMCQPKDSQACLQKMMMKNMPEFSGLFTERNCKAMAGFLECLDNSMDHCEGKKMKDITLGQVYSIMERTPCKGEEETEAEEEPSSAEPEKEDKEDKDKPNGASIASFTASVLLITLLCHTLT